MSAPQGSGGTRAGLIGGLLFVFVGLRMDEVVRTAILAATGAAVSYGVTTLIKWIGRRFRRKV